MTFNKWFPDRPEPPPQRHLGPVGRAWAVRLAWYVSTLMLMVGYVILFVVATR